MNDEAYWGLRAFNVLDIRASLLDSEEIMTGDRYVFFRDACKRTFGFGFYYLQGLVFVLAVDAALTDDEPL